MCVVVFPSTGFHVGENVGTGVFRITGRMVGIDTGPTDGIGLAKILSVKDKLGNDDGAAVGISVIFEGRIHETAADWTVGGSSSVLDKSSSGSIRISFIVSTTTVMFGTYFCF